MDDLRRIYSRPFPRLITESGRMILLRSEAERIELVDNGFPLMFRLPIDGLDVRRDLVIAMHRDSCSSGLSPDAIRTIADLLDAAPLAYLCN